MWVNCKKIYQSHLDRKKFDQEIVEAIYEEVRKEQIIFLGDSDVLCYLELTSKDIVPVIVKNISFKKPYAVSVEIGPIKELDGEINMFLRTNLYGCTVENFRVRTDEDGHGGVFKIVDIIAFEEYELKMANA